MKLIRARTRATTAWIGVGAGTGAAFGAATYGMRMCLAIGIAVDALADTQLRARGKGHDR